MRDYVRAKRRGLMKIDGHRVIVREGAVAHKDHPVAQRRPDIWEPLKADYDVAAPKAEPRNEEQAEPVKRGPGRPPKSKG